MPVVRSRRDLCRESCPGSHPGSASGRPRTPFTDVALSLMLAGAAVLPLTGCGNDRDPQAATTTGSAPATRHGEQVITGNATFDERLRLPPDSVLVVQLLELADDTAAGGGEPPVTLSNVRLVNVQGPSIPFALPYDPGKVDDDGRYGLRAQLSGPGERALFATRSPVPVRPGRAEPIVFDMAYIGVQTSHWQCGPLRLAAGVDPLANRVRLRFSGRELELPLVVPVPESAAKADRDPSVEPSPDADTGLGPGEQYADTAGNAFRIQGERATLTLDGEVQPGCVLSAAPSPWNEAAARGVAFRAVGNEPGWWVEVDRGEAPALRAVLDYGERKLELAHAQPAGLGFAGETADGTQITLEIEREPCQDGMSGERFEATAQLTVDGDTYRGCGAFLPQE